MSGRGSVYRRGTTWTAHVKWLHQGRWRQRKKGGYRTEREAHTALTEMLRQHDLGQAVPADQLTVAGYLDGWLDHLEHVVKRMPSTVRSYRITLASNALPTIGHMRLQKVTAGDLDGIYRAMARRGLKPRTARYLYSILRKAFADAERQGLVPANVVLRSTPPSTVAARAPKFRTWTDAELARFLAHIDGHAHAAAIMFAALTGCRRGEVVGLRWSDVDLDHNRAVIAQSVTDLGGHLDVGDTKAHLAHPIALDDDLVAVLRRHRAAQAEWRLQVGPYWVDRNLVFPGPDGDYMRPATLSQQFDRLVASAGLPRIRLHDLRHGVGTAWARTLGPKAAQQQLRHSTVAFTLDNYVHVSTDELVAGANDLARRRKEGTR